jgi:histone deacetylase 1/2
MPVAKLASIRSILAIAARNDWEISMFDFHSAYLNGTLDEDIYMEQPPDYEQADRQRYVVKLHKTLYGLKQAGKKWYDTLCRSLTEIGFKEQKPTRRYFIFIRVAILSFLLFMLMIPL